MRWHRDCLVYEGRSAPRRTHGRGQRRQEDGREALLGLVEWRDVAGARPLYKREHLPVAVHWGGVRTGGGGTISICNSARLCRR